MKQKTKTPKKSTKKPFEVGSHEGQVHVAVPYTYEDFKNSVLIVSLAVNSFFLIGWLTTQVSSTYAVAVAQAIVQ